LGATVLFAILISQIIVSKLVLDFAESFYDNAERILSQPRIFWAAETEKLKQGLYEEGIWLIVFLFGLATLWSYAFTVFAEIRWRESAIDSPPVTRWLKLKKNIGGSAQKVYFDASEIVRKICDAATDLLRSIFSLCIFIPVLLALGEKGIPAYTLLIAVIAIGIAVSYIATRIGSVIQPREEKRIEAEGKYRGRIERVEKSHDYRRVVDLRRAFLPVRRKTLIVARWNIVGNAWKNLWAMLIAQAVFPSVAVVVFSSGLMTATTLGALNKACGASVAIFLAVAFLMQNWGQIMQIRAHLERLREFEKDVAAVYEKEMLEAELKMGNVTPLEKRQIASRRCI